MLGFKNKRHTHAGSPSSSSSEPSGGKTTPTRLGGAPCSHGLLCPILWGHRGWVPMPIQGWWGNCDNRTWKGLLHRIEEMQGMGQGTVWEETSKEGTRWRRTWGALLWRVNCFPEGKTQWVINELEVEGCYQIYILQRPLLQMCGKGGRLENQTRDDCTGPAKRARNFGPWSWSTKKMLMRY